MTTYLLIIAIVFASAGLFLWWFSLGLRWYLREVDQNPHGRADDKAWPEGFDD